MTRTIYILTGYLFYAAMFVVFQVFLIRAAHSLEDSRQKMYTPISHEDYNIDKTLIIDNENEDDD